MAFGCNRGAGRQSKKKMRNPGKGGGEGRPVPRKKKRPPMSSGEEKGYYYRKALGNSRILFLLPNGPAEAFAWRNGNWFLRFFFLAERNNALLFVSPNFFFFFLSGYPGFAFSFIPSFIMYILESRSPLRKKDFRVSVIKFFLPVRVRAGQ